MKVLFTEQQINKIIGQSSSLILEGDSRLKKLEQIIRQKFGRLFNVDEIVNSETYYVNGNPGTTWLDYIMFSFRHSFGLMSNKDVKYIPEFGRIAISELGFESENPLMGDLQFLKRVVQIVKQQPELFDKYVREKDYKTIYQYFSPIISKLDNDERERINNADYSNSPQDYEILEDVDYGIAHLIGNDSSPQGKLCYTQSIKTWNGYTEDGRNAVYILLKKGWKNIKPRHSECLIKHLEVQDEPYNEYSPYDEYGLSMIFVFVNKKGDLTTCNTRWNHDAAYPLNKDVDLALNKEEISNLIGKPFDSVFKPHKKSFEDLWKFVKKNLNFELVESQEKEREYNVIDNFNHGQPIFQDNFKLYINLYDYNPNLWIWIFFGNAPNTHLVIIDKANRLYHSKFETEEEKYIIFYDENNNKYRFLSSTYELIPCE